MSAQELPDTPAEYEDGAVTLIIQGIFMVAALTAQVVGVVWIICAILHFMPGWFNFYIGGGLILWGIISLQTITMWHRHLWS